MVATLQINGAAAHIHHVILFGFVFHCSVFLIYHIHHRELMRTVKITTQYNSIVSRYLLKYNFVNCQIWWS